MVILLFLCQVVLSSMMLLAATGKMLDTQQFVAALKLSLLPKRLIEPTATLVPLVEIGLAVGLVLTPADYLPLFMLVAIALLSIFTVWMLTIHLHGLHIRCGCFGSGEAQVGLRSIFRNMGFIVIAIVGLMLSVFLHDVLLTPSIWTAITLFSLGMCLSLVRTFLGVKQSLVLTQT